MRLSFAVTVIITLGGITSHADVENENTPTRKLQVQLKNILTKMHTLVKTQTEVKFAEDNKIRKLKETRSKLYAGCDEFYQDGFNVSGVYDIWIRHGYYFLSVYCDMETIGAFSGKRGWMVVQRRMNGQAYFEKSWGDYLHGFGYPDGEYFVGLRNLANLLRQRSIGVNSSRLAVRLDFLDWDGVSAYSECNAFSLAPESSDFKVDSIGICKEKKGLNSPLAYIVGVRFSTYDHDQNHVRTKYCNEQKGGWWFGQCRGLNINGIYSSRREKMSTGKIFVRNWELINSNNTAIKYVAMKLQ